MSALKKKTMSHDLSQFLEKNQILFFFNYNHIKIQEWRVIKSQLSGIKRVKSKVVKNQIANTAIKKKDLKDRFTTLSTLFQGPTFLVGMSSPQDCEQVLYVVTKQKNLNLVGGFYQGQYINHLGLSPILKGEKRVHRELTNLFQSILYTCLIPTQKSVLCSLLRSYSSQGLKGR